MYSEEDLESAVTAGILSGKTADAFGPAMVLAGPRLRGWLPPVHGAC